MLIDISRPVGPGTLLHPGDPPPLLARYSDIAKGGDYNLSLLTTTIHVGTHFDFPLHFDNAGRDATQFPLERFSVTAHVADCRGSASVTPAHLSGLTISSGDAVLLRTDNELAAQDRMRKPWVYIETAAAQFCVERGAGIVGADYIEVESGVNEGEYPVHHTLLGGGVLLLENLDLSRAAAGMYRLFCFPLLIPGCEGSPCRAVLETLD